MLGDCFIHIIDFYVHKSKISVFVVKLVVGYDVVVLQLASRCLTWSSTNNSFTRLYKDNATGATLQTGDV